MGTGKKKAGGVSEVILIFARGPGHESRRKPLSRDPSLAQSAAAELLEHTLEAARAAEADILVAGENELLAHPPEDVGLLRQRGAGFGERLRNAASDAFALGYGRVVMTGTDTPGLTPRLFREAFDRLADGGDRTVVIGPSRDGGYYLVGLGRSDDRPFTGISWRTRRVLAQTRRALAAVVSYCFGPSPTLTDAGSLQHALRRAPHRTTLAALAGAMARSLAALWRTDHQVDSPFPPEAIVVRTPRSSARFVPLTSNDPFHTGSVTLGAALPDPGPSEPPTRGCAVGTHAFEETPHGRTDR